MDVQESPRMIGRGMTMSDQLGRLARTRGDEVAFVLDGVRRSYRTFDERVSRLAGALTARGLGRGDRVVMHSLNSLEAVETYFAVARIGAICVPVNFRLVADEVAYVLSDSGAAGIIAHGPLVQVLSQARDIAGYAGPCLVFDGALDGADDYEQALAEAAPEFEEVPVDPESPAVIMYTSGTTGRPKGAVLTHRNLMLHALSDAVHRGLSPSGRVSLAATPLFHIAAVAGMLTTLAVAGRTVLMRSGRFDPVAVVDLLERERVTACFLVPTQWQAVCDVPDLGRRDLSALRDVGWGAAPATTKLLRTLVATFPRAEVSTTYGQTECGGILTIMHGADALRKVGSVGTPMLNVEVRVVDEQMRDVPRGVVGEAVYRGPMVMREYWNRLEATAEAFAGGWFHSGDLVRQDGDGFFYVVDRLKDMIISGGENIYCAEVEDVVAGHPKVAEVALIGVPDVRWGESPMAVVCARDAADPPTGAELAAWCERRLARYKVPREFMVGGPLPRNASGKVLKRELRAAHQAGTAWTSGT